MTRNRPETNLCEPSSRRRAQVARASNRGPRATVRRAVHSVSRRDCGDLADIAHDGFGVAGFNARRSLARTATWLAQVSPNAAATLREELGEMPTAIEPATTGRLHRSVATTNLIQSATSPRLRETASHAPARRRYAVGVAHGRPDPSVDLAPPA